MKLAIKKVYCSNCQKLIKPREERQNGTTKFVCPVCKNPIWSKDKFEWKHFGSAE
jgi:hypothetical protein